MSRQNRCVASQYNIHIKRGKLAHQYNVEIVFHPAAVDRRPFFLTRGGNAFQKARCRHILQNFDRLRGTFYAYDGQACLWTAQPLEDGVKNIRFEMDNFLYGSLGEDGHFTVSLVYVRTIDLSDLSMYAQPVDNENEDRTLRNVLEMILSQDALERQNNRYASISPGLLCQTAEIPFQRGYVLRNGNSKGVHITKSSNGPQPVLAMRNTQKVFYPSHVNFFDALQTFMGRQWNYDEAERAFRGVKLQLRYNPGRILTFRGFSDQQIGDITFMGDEGLTSLEAYYLHRYGVTIHFLRYPGAIMMEGNAVFPLEQLIIVPDQTVPDFRLPADLCEKALRMNRLPPHQRYNAIADQCALLQMNNPVTRGFGVQIEEKMISGNFTRLNKVAIIAQDGIRLFSNDQGVFKFDKNRYLFPSRANRLVVLSPYPRRSMNCVNAIVAELRRKGAILPEPEFMADLYTKEMKEWNNTLKNFQNQGTIVFIVDSEKEEIHDQMKLAEAMTSVPTQHILLHTAERACGQYFQTLENICHKVNLKTGGLNHQVDFNGQKLDLNLGNILVIGLDVNHPKKRGKTTVSFVGITGNYLEHPCAFAGTFFAQDSNQEAVDPGALYDYTMRMLEKVAAYRTIKTVILMRDGISEGQYKMTLNLELRAIEKAASDFFKHGKTSFMELIITKSGDTLHFNLSNNRPESLPCRSIVNFGTRERYVQFYMVPHRAPQGNSKAVLVTAIKNDLCICEFDIQQFVLALTSLHQICNSPISLPEPIFQADKLAYRGQSNYETFLRYYPNQLPLQGPNYFRELTKKIAFNAGELPNIRYTA